VFDTDFGKDKRLPLSQKAKVKVVHARKGWAIPCVHWDRWPYVHWDRWKANAGHVVNEVVFFLHWILSAVRCQKRRDEIPMFILGTLEGDHEVASI
jgi:hypothetical protein